MTAHDPQSGELLLREATAALRDFGEEGPDRSELRARILGGVVEGRRRRRRTQTAGAMALGALLVASTSWAFLTHRLSLPGTLRAPRAPRADDALARRAPSLPDRGHPEAQVKPAPMAEPGEAAPPVHAAPTSERSDEAGQVQPAPIAEKAATTPSKMTVNTRVTAARHRESATDPAARRTTRSRAVDAAAPAPSAAGEGSPVLPASRSPGLATSDADSRLFRAAHDLHFVQRDPGAALAAWDRYLAAAPDGRFVLEAGYNRAICLVRLGRREAAREVLTPYAEGRHGGYRQREARLILQSLDRPVRN